MGIFNNSDYHSWWSGHWSLPDKHLDICGCMDGKKVRKEIMDDNKWLNERRNEWTNEWMNEWRKEGRNEGMNEGIYELIN